MCTNESALLVLVLLVQCVLSDGRVSGSDETSLIQMSSSVRIGSQRLTGKPRNQSVAKLSMLAHARVGKDTQRSLGQFKMGNIAQTVMSVLPNWMKHWWGDLSQEDTSKGIRYEPVKEKVNRHGSKADIGWRKWIDPVWPAEKAFREKLERASEEFGGDMWHSDEVEELKASKGEKPQLLGNGSVIETNAGGGARLWLARYLELNKDKKWSGVVKDGIDNGNAWKTLAEGNPLSTSRRRFGKAWRRDAPRVVVDMALREGQPAERLSNGYIAEQWAKVEELQAKIDRAELESAMKKAEIIEKVQLKKAEAEALKNREEENAAIRGLSVAGWLR